MSNNKKKKIEKHNPADVEIDGDSIVSLTPQGRMFWEQLLAAASAEAGRSITGDDIHETLQKVKAETGLQDLQFADPVVLACFMKHLRRPATQ